MFVRMAVWSAGLLALLLSVSACGSTPTEPDPVYELKTEVYEGTIEKGGLAAFRFTVVNPGDIDVAITALGPVSTLTMGLHLGFWDATTSTCPAQLSTTSATLNLVFGGSPDSPGDYCVAIFDVGNVQTATTFTLTLTHY